MEIISGNYVGVDYHDARLQICIVSSEGKILANRSCRNDIGDCIKLIRQYGEVQRVCAEACSGSVEFLEELSRVTGWDKRLCHPGYVRRMKNNPDKSDKSDSELIADLDRVDYLPQVWFAPLPIRDLRTLVRYRSQQIESRKKAKLRIRGLLRRYRVYEEYKTRGLWSKAGLAWLKTLEIFPPQTLWVFKRHLEELSMSEKSIREVEKELRTFCKTDPMSQKLLEQAGIGLVSATALRAEVGDFRRFRNGKQLARFCGLTPCNASSGNRQADAGLIRAGNPILKTALIEATHHLVTRKHHADFVKRLKEAGKPYPVIIAAVANRWVRRLYWIMRNWQEKSNALSC